METSGTVYWLFKPLVSMGKLGIIVRSDATPQMGTGHVMRCIALAQAAQSRRIPVTIIGHIGVPWVQQRLVLEGINFVNLEGPAPVLEDPVKLLQQFQIEESAAAQWVVLDGYHFGLDCQQAVRNAGYKLLVIDDYAHLPEYSCDILLNQNLDSQELLYQGAVDSFLRGPEFALIRNEFISHRASLVGNKRYSDDVNRLLISLGGGNFIKDLKKIALGLANPLLCDSNIKIVAGAMPGKEVLNLFNSCPGCVELVESTNDMPQLMAWADLCISAGGSSCWELCLLGVPFLTVCVAENQKRIIEGLAAREIAPKFNQQSFNEMLSSRKMRYKSGQNGMVLVDGHGAIAVLQKMELNC